VLYGEVPFHVQRNPFGIKQKQKKSIFIYGTTFKKNKFIPRFSASPNLFYRSQKQKKNYGSHPLMNKIPHGISQLSYLA
jgi:hypothetical protein